MQDRARDFSTYGSDTGLKDIVVKFTKFKVESKTENMTELLKI